jgi:hypothetical protein
VLGEDERAVAHDVELTVRAGADRGLESFSLQLGRETRGPAVVAASDRAIEDLDAHREERIHWWCGRTSRRRAI